MRSVYTPHAPKPLMDCGCVANSHISMNGKVYHFCVIHETADTMEEVPDLSGRTAKCDYCNKEAKSDLTLPFFRYMSDCKEDRYYCGCRGWY